MGLLMSAMARARLGAVSDYDSAITDAAERYGVSPDLIRSIMGVESSGNPDASGAAGEVGLMQVMPSTAQGVDPSVTPAALWDPVTNIDIGVHYLADQLRRYGGNVAQAVSAYNAGHATDANQSYVDKVIGTLWPTPATDASGALDVSTPDANQSYVDKVIGTLWPTPATDASGALDVSTPVGWVQEHPWLTLALGGLAVWVLTRRR
jgi:soluble lytic murein transglycosylase-like protein